MRVFISSVTARLKNERHNLAALLAATGTYEPVRFEDFTAQDRSARDACFAGVRSCDAYVLLLGPVYGQRWPDSNLAATEEEFKLAQRLDKPTLVFVKATKDEPDEPEQAAFKQRVESYIDGRFRASFTDSQTLNVSVVAALGELHADSGPLVWEQLNPPTPPRWRWDTPPLNAAEPNTPVLDVHLIPLNGISPVLTSRLQALPDALARAGRDTGFFAQSDPLQTSNDSTLAWAWTPNTAQPGIGFHQRRVNDYRGLAVHVSGQVTAFEALPTDFAGALVNKPELQTRIARLLATAATHLPPDAQRIAVAASINPADRVWEGDPADVNGRTGSRMRITTGLVMYTSPDLAVPADALRAGNHTGDVAAELAARLLQTIREAPS